MYSWSSTNAKLGITLNNTLCFPGVERIRRSEPFLLELSNCVVRGYNWQVFIELLLHHAIEMIFMHVREDNQVEWGQFLEFHCGIGSTSRTYPIPQMHMLTLMEKVWVSQDGESCVAKNDGCVSNEEE
jgi:hypothetical protein